MKKVNNAGWQACAVIAAALLVQSCTPAQKHTSDAAFALTQNDSDLDAQKGGHKASDTNLVMAENTVKPSADFSDSVGNDEMDKVRGGSNVITIQNSIISDNELNGTFTTGDNNINNSFNNTTVMGNVVQATCYLCSMNISTNVDVTIQNTPPAAR